MGKLYSILTETRTHLIPNCTPLPPLPNYQELRDSSSTDPNSTSPDTCKSPIRKKQRTIIIDNNHNPNLIVPGLNGPGLDSDPRANANVATPDGSDRY
jgi:hypothetical protein